MSMSKHIAKTKKMKMYEKAYEKCIKKCLELKDAESRDKCLKECASNFEKFDLKININKKSPRKSVKKSPKKSVRKKKKSIKKSKI